MDVDPLASMRCWAIDIELGGHLFEVPPLTAADWWSILVGANPLLVLDVAVSTDGADLDEMILSGEVTAAELNEATMDAIEAVTGRPFQAAYVLATVAAKSWPVVGGQLAQSGFRWEEQPIGAALDAIYSIVVPAIPEKSEDGKRKPREEFLALLDKPMPGSKRQVDRDKALSEFEELAGPRPTSGVRSTGEPSGSAHPRTPTQPRPRPPGGRSRAPRRQPEPPAGNDLPASSGRRPAEAEPASDTEPRPPL